MELISLRNACTNYSTLSTTMYAHCSTESDVGIVRLWVYGGERCSIVSLVYYRGVDLFTLRMFLKRCSIVSLVLL